MSFSVVQLYQVAHPDCRVLVAALGVNIVTFIVSAPIPSPVSRRLNPWVCRHLRLVDICVWAYHHSPLSYAVTRREEGNCYHTSQCVSSRTQFYLDFPCPDPSIRSSLSTTLVSRIILNLRDPNLQNGGRRWTMGTSHSESMSGGGRLKIISICIAPAGHDIEMDAIPMTVTSPQSEQVSQRPEDELKSQYSSQQHGSQHGHKSSISRHTSQSSLPQYAPEPPPPLPQQGSQHPTSRSSLHHHRSRSSVRRQGSHPQWAGTNPSSPATPETPPPPWSQHARTPSYSSRNSQHREGRQHKHDHPFCVNPEHCSHRWQIVEVERQQAPPRQVCDLES